VADQPEWTLSAYIAHNEAMNRATVELAEMRDRHLAEMRALEQKYNEVHFLQLNENAKRTIEERGHFVSVEAYAPFRDQILKFINATGGQERGSDRTIAYLVTAVSVLVALASLAVALLK
jgi:hypothetical protein